MAMHKYTAIVQITFPKLSNSAALFFDISRVLKLILYKFMISEIYFGNLLEIP